MVTEDQLTDSPAPATRPPQSRQAPAVRSPDGSPETALRSSEWFAAEGRPGMIYRSWLRAEGFVPEVFDGRPVIGIANSWSELTPCNAHLRGVAESVKRGVWEAGGSRS